MTNEIKDLEKACRETAEAGSEMLKAHVKAYTRITSSGERVQVKEHDDSRRTGLDYDQMKKQVKQHLEEHKANGFKIVGESHDADGISVDASKADHHHYFLEDDKGNRATVYHHTQGDHLHTVGASTDGSVPYHPTGTKYLLLPEEWTPDLHKSHVRQYTRQDGTVVQEHDDSRADGGHGHQTDPDFAAGMKARAMGKHHLESPHKHTSPRGLKWLAGWNHQKEHEENKGMYKSHVRSYTRKDGTAVKEHEDSRQAAIKAIENAEMASKVAVKSGKPLHHKVAATAHRKAAELNPEHKKYHEDLAEKHEAVESGKQNGQGHADLKKHPMWSESDHNYFKGKGYTDKEIKAIWDRDQAAGHEPVIHKKAPDVVGVIADPNHYKKKAAKPTAKNKAIPPQSDANRHKWDDLPDEENPRYSLQGLSSIALGKVAKGTINARNAARYELEKRGHDTDGKWIGFDAAEQHHASKYEKDDTDFRLHKHSRGEISDEFQSTHEKILSSIAAGHTDPKRLAGEELANRGHDHDGKWIGFDKAAKLHKVKE